MENNRAIVRITRLEDQGREADLKESTPAERLAMVWPLTVDAWMFKGEDIAQYRLQRDITHVHRLKE